MKERLRAFARFSAAAGSDVQHNNRDRQMIFLNIKVSLSCSASLTVEYVDRSPYPFCNDLNPEKIPIRYLN